MPCETRQVYTLYAWEPVGRNSSSEGKSSLINLIDPLVTSIVDFLQVVIVHLITLFGTNKKLTRLSHERGIFGYPLPISAESLTPLKMCQIMEQIRFGLFHRMTKEIVFENLCKFMFFQFSLKNMYCQFNGTLHE